MELKVKRIYDEASGSDGFRILVDRLWPRGVSKDQAQIDLWAKDAAPSDNLRKWFKHDRAKWPEFKERYFEELNAKDEVIRDLIRQINDRQATLVFAAKDPDFNNATALLAYLQRFDEL